MNLQQKILIVDDRKENLVALRQILRDVDAGIIEASSGNEALAATLDHSFALAILDVMMPGMSGFELAKHLRGDDATRLLPIVFVTAAYPDEQHIFSGYEAGAVDYIVKPFAPDMLLAKVRIFLEMDRQKQELQLHRDRLEMLVAERTAKLERELAERKRVEAALVESELCYRALADSGQALIWTAGTDKLCNYFNEPWLRFTGRSLEQELGNGWTEGVHAEDYARCLQTYVTAFDRREKFSIEYRLRHASGEYRWLIDDCTPCYDGKGDFTGYIGHCLDITERKQAEAERHKLQEQLFQAQKMESVGLLAGGVAHDFNNMIGVILGNAEMALMQMTPEQPLYELLQEIRNAAERSANLTRQLLAFASKQTVAPKVLDLNETVTGLLKMLQRLIGEDIELFWLPGEDLAPLNIDPGQIDQMLVNLCVNARDAINGIGSITIKTGNITLDAGYCSQSEYLVPGDYLLLSVSDTGCGMNKEAQARIFEPFFTTKEMGKGTGLGLSTVYGIVRQNNGFINVASEPGQETVFRIYLPRHSGNGELSPAENVPEAIGSGNETVLLVEDETAILDIGKIMLESLGYRVLAAKTADDALDLAANHAAEIALMITDVIMPKLNGRDLAKQLLTVNPNLKLLFMSGYTADIIADHGVLEEGTHFIQKPFSMKELANKVREVLGSGNEATGQSNRV